MGCFVVSGFTQVKVIMGGHIEAPKRKQFLFSVLVLCDFQNGIFPFQLHGAIKVPSMRRRKIISRSWSRDIYFCFVPFKPFSSSSLSSLARFCSGANWQQQDLAIRREISLFCISSVSLNWNFSSRCSTTTHRSRKDQLVLSNNIYTYFFSPHIELEIVHHFFILSSSHSSDDIVLRMSKSIIEGFKNN